MTTSLFDCSSYREFLKTKIEENREIRGYQSRLAQAAGCQRSGLSQVLNGHIELTIDQAANLAQHWELNADQAAYFLDLVALERAGTPSAKAHFSRKISEARKKRDDLAQRFQVEPLGSTQQELVYYSAWYWSAVHVLVSIPGMGSAKACAKRLGLPVGFIQKIFQGLEEMGIIKPVGDQWKVVRHHIHLPKSSPMTLMNHTNWRQKALLGIQAPNEGSLHYSNVFAASRKDIERIRAIFLKAIDECRERIEGSPEEELACITMDLFTT